MAPLPVAVLISGRGTNLQALIDAGKATDCPYRIVLVISNKPTAYGLERAEKANIPTAVISHKDYPDRESFDRVMDAAIRTVGAEFVCLAGFMRLLSPWFIDAWRDRLINIHPSLLPLFKGLHAQQQALDAGVRLTGCTVHFVTKEMDAGPIILQAALPIHSNDTSETLETRLLEVEHKAYPKALNMIALGQVRVTNGKVEIEHNPLPTGFILSEALC